MTSQLVILVIFRAFFYVYNTSRTNSETSKVKQSVLNL